MAALAKLALVAATLVSSTYADTCVEEAGNWYCDEVKAISYSNLGSNGTYQQVSYMSDSTGACDFNTTAYSGTIAPFNEELSVHIRGPFSLKKFAYYTASTTTTARLKSRATRGESRRTRERRMAEERKAIGERKALEERSAIAERHALEERSLAYIKCPYYNNTVVKVDGQDFMIECAMDRPGFLSTSHRVTFGACIRHCAETDGCEQVTYIKDDNGNCTLKSSSEPLLPQDYIRGHAGARLLNVTTGDTDDATTSSSAATSTCTSTKTVTSTKTETVTISSSTSAAATASDVAWTRQSYYCATSQVSTGLTFLNNLGGGSYPGVWSTYFGNSLGYASADGLEPAMESTVLADTTLPSTNEISLWTSTECSDADPCPYYRPDTVAYHGFGGDAKILAFEFTMPHATGDDMPALWLLNAQIPRTEQYGTCSCWGNTDGCGELDIFEVLTEGYDKMISAVHGVQAATDPDYFARPTNATIKAAVVLGSGTMDVVILDDAFDFDAGLTQAQVDRFVSQYDSADVGTYTLN